MLRRIAKDALYWSAVVVLIGLGIKFALREPPNPDLERALQLSSTLASLPDELPASRREALMRELNQSLQNLKTAPRNEILARVCRDIEGRRARELARFFEMPELEQVAALDRRIDLMKIRRRASRNVAWESQPDEAAKHGNGSIKVAPEPFGLFDEHPGAVSSHDPISVLRDLASSSGIAHLTPQQVELNSQFRRMLDERRAQREMHTARPRRS